MDIASAERPVSPPCQYDVLGLEGQAEVRGRGRGSGLLGGRVRHPVREPTAMPPRAIGRASRRIRGARDLRGSGEEVARARSAAAGPLSGIASMNGRSASMDRGLKVRRVPARQARCETWSTSVDDPDAQDVVVAEMTSY